MNMTLNLNTPKPPVVAISPRSVNITVPGNVVVSVIDSASSNLTKQAFTLGIVSG